MEATSAGEVDMTFLNNGNLGIYDRRWDMLTAPDMIVNLEHMQRLMKTDVYKSMEEDLEKKNNLKILCWIWSPEKSYLWNSKRPVVTPKDWEGLKIRSMSHIPTRMILEAFKSPPIVLDMGEVPSAIAQGVVDGTMTAILSGVDSYKAIDMLPYLTIPYNWAMLDSICAIVVNANWYENKVPNDLKVVIEKKLDQITKVTDKMLQDGIAVTLKKYEEAPNTTVTYLTEGQTKVWAKIVDEKVTKKLAQDYPALFEAAKATRP